MAARRALTRWAARLLRREWRQQVTVVALITVGAAAAVFCSAAVFNVVRPPEGRFGSADYRLEVSVQDEEQVEPLLAATREHFGLIEVIESRSVPVQGSVDAVEARAQDPKGPFGAPMVRLLGGRFPARVDEVALTDGAAALLGADVGDVVPLGDRANVVGVVENPHDLDDEFALVLPGSEDAPGLVSVLFTASAETVQAFELDAPPGSFSITDRQSDRSGEVLLVVTISAVGMLLVGLVASAGFAVVAQRRQRQLGMLAAVGATPRQLRRVVVANGVIVGLVSAAAGLALGLGAWLLFAQTFEGVAGHRIGRFDLPWGFLVASAGLAVGTATASAWWPARIVARTPVVDALSARPPRRVAPRRSALAAVVFLAAGIGSLGTGIDPTRDYANPFLVITGLVATAAAIVFGAAPSIRTVALAAAQLPLAARLAVRDLARNQARSSAALAATSVGLAIAVSVVVVAAADEHGAEEGNVSDRQLIAWVGGERPDLHVPERSSADLERSAAAVDAFAATLADARAVRLDVGVGAAVAERRGAEIVHPSASLGRRVGPETLRFVAMLYVASPDLLDHLSIEPDAIGADTVVLTSLREPAYIVGELDSPFRRAAVPADQVMAIDAQHYDSAPQALLTEHGLERSGLQRATAGWLIESARPLTDRELAAAREMAVDAGLTIEARDEQPELATLRTGASIAGVLLALAILAMTVGLLRSEAAADLRTLSAAGATSHLRRTLTATTAGALAAVAVVIGTVTAYAALLAGYWPDLDRLGNVPVAHLVTIAIALPVIASGASWLVAGREPPAIARRPIE